MPGPIHDKWYRSIFLLLALILQRPSFRRPDKDLPVSLIMVCILIYLLNSTTHEPPAPRIEAELSRLCCVL